MKKYFACLFLSFLYAVNAAAEPAHTPSLDIARTVVKVPLADDVSPEDSYNFV